MPHSIDVIRTILLEVGQQPAGRRWAATSIAGYSDVEIIQNVKAAMDEQLVVGMIGPSGKTAIIYRITSKGSEFLEVAKHAAAWDSAKRLLSSQGKPMSIASIISALRTVA